MNFFICVGIVILGISAILLAYVSIILLYLILCFPSIREYKHSLKVTIIHCVIFSILTILGLLLIK